MKSWVQTLFLLSTLALTACSQNFQDSTISCDQKALDEKAIVVLDGIAPYCFMYLTDREAIVHSEWERIEPTCDKKIVYKFMSYEEGHMVLPGTYQLRSLTYTIGNNDYFIDFPKTWCITFTAYPGEYIYIGDIIIKNATQNTSVPLLDDRSEKAIWCVKPSLSKIKKPFEKRLIEGLQCGHLAAIKACL